MEDVRLREIGPGDHAWIARVNDGAVPAVSAFAPGELPGTLAMAAWARIAERGGAPAGLAIAFLPGTAYDCANYLWFQRRYAHFLYIDRIVVAATARGAGIGRLLYADAERFAGGRATHLACEVNERPPNPGSLRFHAALGFRPVGRQSTEGGTKDVVLLLKPLAAPLAAAIDPAPRSTARIATGRE